MYQLQPAITWSLTNSSSFGARYRPAGSIFDVNGMSLFTENDANYMLGFLCSVVASALLKVINPTWASQAGDIAKLPCLFLEKKNESVEETIEENISISRTDWDAFETSWDFKCHPLIIGERTVAEAFAKWEYESFNRFVTLKKNEEEINRIFIDIYGLHDELSPEVEDKDISIRRSNLGREIRSLISYAVGCMFGRYSLDVPGLASAGGDWDSGKYQSYIPEDDNILPITDADYFEDDIVMRFVDFVKVVYGEDTLTENLEFIARALYPNG